MKILLKNNQSPGDILMLTAAVRDLKEAHHSVQIGVATSAMPLWDNNWNIDRSLRESDVDRVIRIGYPLINESDKLPYHFVHAFRKELEMQLGLSIPQGPFKGDLHLTDDEKRPLPAVAGMKRYWIVDAGYKRDFTLKNWGVEQYQKVVDMLRGKVTFVQIGEASKDHMHRPLNGAVNLIGKTSIRELIRLVYGAAGVLTPVSFPMHLAAAVPTPDGRLRPCVVVAGGREPSTWEAYPGHVFLHTVGMLDCCRSGGCWRARAEKLNDGTASDRSICSHPVRVGCDLIGKCMALVRPETVASIISDFEDNA